MSVGREQSLFLTIAVAAGTGVGAVSPLWAITRWVRIVPTSESDTYDVTFKDGDGDIMLARTGLTGTMSERLEMSLGILKTITIANSNSTGNYKAKFDLH